MGKLERLFFVVKRRDLEVIGSFPSKFFRGIS